MPYLQSHALEAVAYDEARHVLRAKFRASGLVMLYEDVPPEVYDSLIFAQSIGRFFSTQIEGRYRCRRA